MKNYLRNSPFGTMVKTPLILWMPALVLLAGCSNPAGSGTPTYVAATYKGTWTSQTEASTLTVNVDVDTKKIIRWYFKKYDG